MMRHQKYYDIWTEFIKEYSNKFMNYHEKWILRLDEVKDFIKKYDKIPSRYSKDSNESQLGDWIQIQKYNFKNSIKMLKYENILKIWQQFSNEYKKYL